jgi:hypothetical protein
MNRSQSKKSEERIERVTGLARTPGSGCGKLFKGDNGDERWHVEDKSTRKDCLQVQRLWWEKVIYQAASKNKPLMALCLSSPFGRYVMLPRDVTLGYEYIGDYSIQANSFRIDAIHCPEVLMLQDNQKVGILWHNTTKFNMPRFTAIVTELTWKKYVEETS